MAQLRPTFSESWYRVAQLTARLRGSTQISRQHYRGERWYVVRDPAGNQFHRLSAAAYRFVGLLDGTRTVGEAWDLVGGTLADDAPTQPEVIQILSQLHAANLLEANITADATVLLRRHKQLRKRQMQGRLMNILFPRIPLWDPDRFLKRWMPVMKIFLSKFGALLWFVTIIGALVAVAPEWDRLKDAAKHAIDFSGNKQNYIWLFLTFVVIKLIHELGHAFSCRRFGGEVHELGIMFLVFIPAPYVDASSAWALPSRWARAFVGTGGMVFELFVAAILAFVWKYTSPDSMVNQMAYNAMLIASVSTLVFNANPLLRYDGYYILSDMLEIPNLRQKSSEYSLGLIKRHVFGVKSPVPLPPPAQRVWLLLYSVASGIYRVMVGVTIILVVSNQVPVLGVLMAFGGVITWAVVPVAKLLNYLMLDAELHRKRARAGAFVAVMAAAAVVLIGIVRFPVHFRATGVVQPVRFDVLRADYNGFATAINVRDGDAVKKTVRDKAGNVIEQGTVLVVLTNRDLDAHIQQLEAKAKSLEVSISKGRVDDPAQKNTDEKQLKAVVEELNSQKLQKSRLNVTSSVDGVVVAPTLDELRGKYLHEGEEIATVQAPDQYIVKAMLPQEDAALVLMKQAEAPKIRLASARGREVNGKIVAESWEIIDHLSRGDLTLSQAGGGEFQVDPNDPQKRKLEIPQYGVRVELAAGAPLVTGQRAYVRFTLDRQPLLQEWTRKFWQLIQTQTSRNKWL